MVSVLLHMLCVVPVADWPQFRGPGNNPAAVDADLPTRWGDKENVAWRADLPGRGVSCPIVVGRRLFLTASSGAYHERLHVLCLDVGDGRRLWERQFWATGRTSTHPSVSVATPTPVSDGQYVYAFYSSNDLICLDLDGNLRWVRGLTYDYPKSGNDVGMAASPAVADGTVVVQIESQGESFIEGIATATGETRWHLDRERKPTWCSPVVLPGGGARKTAVLVQAGGGLTALDIRNGAPLWQIAGPCAGMASSLVVGDRLYTPLKGLSILRLADAASTPEVVWESNRMRPGAASPLVVGNRVYTVAESIVKCGDADTGNVLWQLRLKGQHWATPVIAGGHMYCLSEPGEARVIRLGDRQGEVVFEHDFGESLHASPIVADNSLFVRSDQHLWKIKK